MREGFAIAIDGPVASGKGTIAHALAKELNGVNFYTGGMYRALGLKCLNKSKDLTDPAQVLTVLDNTIIELRHVGGQSISAVYLDGVNVDKKIIEPEVAQAASVVANHEDIRKRLVEMQKNLAKETIREGKIVIMEGRIVAKEVLPNAEFKLYLTADLQTRANRRYIQYKAEGINKNLDEVVEDTLERDERDKDHLSEEPEKLGYFVFDDSGMTEEQTLNAIKAELQKRHLVN
jgi:cytidylate kinase